MSAVDDLVVALAAVLEQADPRRGPGWRSRRAARKGDQSHTQALVFSQRWHRPVTQRAGSEPRRPSDAVHQPS